jgi:hypothetical protein
MEVRAPGGEVTFFAPDMTAGAFVIEAPGLAHLDPTVDSVSPPPAATTCHLQAGAVVSVVYLISQAPPALRGDSVHIAFLQVAGAGDVAIRAGAFATTRALRDSIVGALLAFQPW